MPVQMQKTYNPKDFEERIYEFWLKNNFFKASVQENKKSYTIVIPPPNVTDVLHMGHGLNNTIQDILIRRKRMQGYNTLWVPGTDHAGIATQNVVEKRLHAQGKKREDYSRDEFENIVRNVALEHKKAILSQLRKMGCSCDWSREAFTLDKKRIKAVKEVFIRLFEKKLIYKGKYIINWCPRCLTALSDDEVEHNESNGYLWHIKYPVKGSDQFITVATTRPETMLGDTAVAVNDKDPRFTHLKNKKIILPLVKRELNIIFDSFVDPEFGTGLVKVTPAHDSNDAEMGYRHNLDFINIFHDNATLNQNVPQKYRDLDRYKVRKMVVSDLEELGLIEKIENHTHSVGSCYRCRTTIEPRYSSQWFVKMKDLAKKAIDAVKQKKIVFLPNRWEKVYYNWMNNIRDWCISRQLWWGHRIPVYYCQDCQEIIVRTEIPETCPKCQSDNIKQDTDVLDTWFSSWLWPFSTLGWPEKTRDLELFYPTNTLVTGPDIIFFWVARMIMAGLEFMNDIPFSEVYFTGMVMDKQGRKMSKSLGNGINPLDVIDQYGSDALRYTMVAIVSPNQNLRLGMDSFSIGTKFANKIWNATRFILMNLDDDFEPLAINYVKLDMTDKWILTLFNRTVEKVNQFFEQARLNDLAIAIQHFIWHNFCDWYIEFSKTRLFSNDKNVKTNVASVLIFILDQSLRLLHPIMCYITEEIWQKLPVKGESIMTSAYPEYNEKQIYKRETEQIEILNECIYLVRNVRSEVGISPNAEITVYIKSSADLVIDTINTNKQYFQSLTKTTQFYSGKDIQRPENFLSGANEHCEIFIPLKGLIDIEKEKKRIQKDIQKTSMDLEKLEKKLNNPAFLSKAKPEVVKKVKTENSEINIKLNRLKKILKDFA